MICGKCNSELADRAHFCPHCRSVFMYQGETKEQVADLVRQEYQQYLQQQQELQERTRKEQQEAWQEIERARAEIESQREQLAAQQQEIQAQREQMEAQGRQLQEEQQLAQQQAALQAQQAAQAFPQASPAKASASQQPDHKPVSGLAVASLVLGILAIGTSFVPIVNNWSFIIAVVGFFFALVGLGDTGKVRQNRGRAMAASGLVLSIASIAIVLVTQSFFVSVLDQFADRVQHGEKPAASSEAGVDYSQMSIGQSVTLENGMTIRVNDVERGVESLYSGEMTRVNVTYENGGKSNGSFNTLDWKAADAGGVLDMATIFTNGDSDLGSGQLMPGGSVTGDIYFQGDIIKVYYYSSALLQSDSSICWVVG